MAVKPSAKAPSRSAAKKARPAFTIKSDAAADKKAGIKPGSAKDKKLDAKRGLKK